MENITKENISENPSQPEEKASKSMEFYEKAQKYWSEVPATVNGMLGGNYHA